MNTLKNWGINKTRGIFIFKSEMILKIGEPFCNIKEKQNAKDKFKNSI